MANLSLRGISKSFGPLDILNDVNLDVKAGETVAILGPSGAGKSTLLHIAGLMEKPTRGEVHIEGKHIKDLSDTALSNERLNQVGFLFQFHYLLPDFDVLDNVLMPTRLANDAPMESLDRAMIFLERLGLKDRLTHRPHQLSGGEQQRVALARAMIRHPKVLLCDEPTGNLDEGTARDVISLLWDEVKRNNVSTIIVTHNEMLAKETNRSYYLAHGRLVESRR
jgi:lipoprotein-releasing system ATP-binding protein